MVAKSFAVIGVMLALVGYLVLGTGSAVAVPSLTDETETPISTATPDSPTPTPATPTPELDRLSGLVTLNGKVAPPGLGLIVISGEILCGETSTEQGGRYEVDLRRDCGAGTEVTFQLAAVPLIEGPKVKISGDPQQVANVAFEGLTATDLLALGVRTEPDVVEATVADVIEALGPSPAVSDGQIITGVVLLVIGGLVALVVLAKLKYLARDSDIDYSYEVQALVLILVLAAALLFGLSGNVRGEGIVAVFSSIAAFTLGTLVSRQRAPKPASTDNAESDNPAT